ncbi:MAG: hypothetical protein II502_02005, partial [Paludibacteraceae bacterium]|nr:hypothetical protein [Paludibacteraceae bacterium]
MKRNLFFLCGLLLSMCVVWAQQTDSIQGVEVPAVVDSVNNATTTTVEQPKVASQPTQRAAVLSGPFTISPSAVVKFSPGNLQYNPKQKIWRFAPNQHDMIGKVNSHISD